MSQENYQKYFAKKNDNNAARIYYIDLPANYTLEDEKKAYKALDSGVSKKYSSNDSGSGSNAVAVSGEKKEASITVNKTKIKASKLMSKNI